MNPWEIKRTKKYNAQYGKCEKKHPDELLAINDNFETYKMAVDITGNPLHPQVLNRGFIHREPKGMIAIDQTGVITDKTLQETRLYIYPDMENKTLYLLTLGDKNTQKRDIKWCLDMLKKI